MTTAREADGRWLAEIPELPGVMSYGATRDAALSAAKVLALHVLADSIDAGELGADSLVRIHFGSTTA